VQIVFGQIAYIFAGVEDGGRGRAESKQLINHYTLYFLYLALGALVTWFISTAGFAHTGARITRRIKAHFFSSVLRQNMAVFDTIGTGNMVTQLTADANVIQEGISQKLSLTISAIGTLVATYAVSFALNWKISFMLTWSVFLSLLFLYGGNKIAVRYSKRSAEANSSGISIVEEALGSIRSTTALGMQGYIAKTYDEHLSTAEKAGVVLKTLMGTMVGITVGTGYLNVALALWQGSIFLVDEKISFMAVVAITLITKTAAFCVLGVGQNAEAFTSAIAASGRIFRMINRESPIDPMSDGGLTPGSVRGTIELRNVKHIYPSRPGVVVAHDLSLTLPSGKTTALVGPSGSGKSSVAQLIMRFYDPIRGQVLLDNCSLRELNLKWLRRQMRFVNQEPFLFDTTVLENIEHGFVGTRFEGISAQEKMERVEKAARIACAHDFICSLPSGYLTRVGSRGSQLSGGQKQRVAIARAIVADPKILILDEATSALDTNTEALVQGALNNTSANRTTIIIAHRLSTIRDADNIVVVKDGRVVEQGTHEALMASNGVYFDLVEAQRVQQEETDDEQISDNDADHYSMSSSDDKKEASAVIEAYDYASLSPASYPQEKKASYSLLSMVKFVLGLNAKERHLILMGLLCSIIAGFEEPLSAILFGKAIVAVSKPLSLSGEILSESSFYSWMFFLLALVMILVFCIQSSVFAYCSERLVHRARNLALGKLLQREIAFFDRRENSASALTSFLSAETADLAGISGGTLGTILIAVSTIISAFVVGLIFGWKLGLVCSAVIPILIGCGFLAVWSVGEFEKQNEKFTRASAAYAGEAISAIQTIAALTRELDVVKYYQNSLTESSKENLKSHLRASFMFALARTGLYACMGLGFWYGGTLILSHEYSLFQFTVVYMTVIMSAYSAGIIFSFAPNIGKARRSAHGLKQLLDSTSAIDPESPAGRDPGTPQGHVDFRNVSFSYPTRPERLALRNVSLSIPAGGNIALVGSTGCGKSTIISLLERFYDPHGGAIFLDGVPISSFNVKKFRRCIGLVNQEPTMISGSIKMNLLAGLDGEHISHTTIENACKQANIYDFIASLP
jgi:ATP-binding cassette subfamily B (MDR/TAP) protein 1